MKILEDLLSTLDCQTYVRDIRQGPFQTAVLTRECGLASTPHESGPHHGVPPVKDAGKLSQMGVYELAHMALSTSAHEAAIGMATINSLLKVDEGRCVELNAGDLLCEKGAGKSVAIIGHFPFISRLRQFAMTVWVIERRPREGDLTEEQADIVVPQADVVGITGTAFTNHTIEHLLSLCRRDAYVVILGDTAPLSPVLFSYGVSAVSGTKVVDPDTVLRCVSQGATFRQVKGVRLLTMLR